MYHLDRQRRHHRRLHSTSCLAEEPPSCSRTGSGIGRGNLVDLILSWTASVWSTAGVSGMKRTLGECNGRMSIYTRKYNRASNTTVTVSLHVLPALPACFLLSFITRPTNNVNHVRTRNNSRDPTRCRRQTSSSECWQEERSVSVLVGRYVHGLLFRHLSETDWVWMV